MNTGKKKQITEFMELLADSILPIIFWISVIFGFDVPYVAILTIISAVIHEFGHYVAIACFTGKNARVHGHSSGLRIKRSGSLSYGKEIAILMAGPIMNILIFLSTIPLGASLDGYIKIFGYINLATGISNLLPFEGYDGYGAMCEGLKYCGKERYIRHLEAFSFILSVGVTFISLHLIDKFSEGYWIFGLFFFTILSKLVNFGKYDIFEQ